MRHRLVTRLVAILAFPLVGIGRLLWVTRSIATDAAFEHSAFAVPSPETQIRSSSAAWRATRCFRIFEDLAHRRLPEGGVLYCLGNISMGANRYRPPTDDHSRRYLVLSGAETATWDMLWSDYFGAFDRKKGDNVTLFIPQRNAHAPLFLVSYSKEPIDVHVVHVDKTSDATFWY
mmetsp:Transcript_55466/g.166330  ORF Transcript_55466/g.166330 Transcript_55466/m.166330 type:complete len:175 (+) Transcript_55466:443-967(+)